MGAEQSLDGSGGRSSSEAGRSSPYKWRETGDSSTSSSTGATQREETFSNNRTSENQTNAARSDSLRSAILPSTSTTPSSETSGDNKWQSKYPFREKVKHLPLAERKEQYELEIRRLFESPHPSHITRLKPEKVIAEKADISHTCNSFVTWNPMQLTYDIGKGALSQRAFKRCNRSRPDPWRRYGALRKLHEIGGIGCTPPNQVGVRVQQTFYVIEPGSTPPAPPLSAPITTVEEYGTTDILLNPKKRKKPEPYIEKME